MAISSNHVYLYAATTDDYLKCLAAADVSGIPYKQCLGSFDEAWRLISGGQDLVIAVGGAALYSLYYNPCNWPNPAAQPGGHTPFALYAVGLGVQSIQTNYFVNAGGYTALDSLTLAVMLSYYAIHGNFPVGYTNLPRQEIPQHVCVSNASAKVVVPSQILSPSLSRPTVQPVSSSGGTSPTPTKPSVGLYASYASTNMVQQALNMGWPGLATTAALGTPSAPFTQVLSSKPDETVALGLEQANSNAWWLSFWTVSWPDSGTTFYQAGYDAGKYAGEQIDTYPGSRKPNFVILDPEGYNQPAQTSKEFQDFINGFSAGVHSVDPNLQTGFYANQSQYSTYQLSQVNLPAFVAIAPIAGNQPQVSGKNIKGYAAYYATCPVQSSITQVESWGALYNTVQFRDSGVDCGPV